MVSFVERLVLVVSVEVAPVLLQGAGAVQVALAAELLAWQVRQLLFEYRWH